MAGYLLLAKWIIVAFGLFIVFVGLLMLLAPERAIAALKKAASTSLINYSEITLRLIPAVSLVLYAGFSRYPVVFNYFGYFMIITSAVLYLIPRRLHHQYALWNASLLTPMKVRLISPFSFLLGGYFIYAVL
ncbi:hypothetical protein [Ekhidna sp.]|uniref:hypothetical protein n=1 Tax=Ekhidna sp. TaxID=2608089 RepID=UPI0032EEE4CD